jgi:hypothetical protein
VGQVPYPDTFEHISKSINSIIDKHYTPEPDYTNTSKPMQNINEQFQEKQITESPPRITENDPSEYIEKKRKDLLRYLK